MTILTADEAARALRTTNTDPAMLDLLPQVDAYIRQATGRDWSADSTVEPTAKSAAMMLLVMWHEDPAMIGSENAAAFGVCAALTQLEAQASSITFTGASGSGYCALPGAQVGDLVAGLVEIAPTPGDAKSLFESVITYKDSIRQISDSDLSQKTYRVRFSSAVNP